MNNHYKITGVRGALPTKVREGFLPKTAFHGWGINLFGQKIYGEVVLNGRTNDQFMVRWGRSFINDKCIFQ